MSVNKVILLGRLGKDPELKYTNSGAAVCKLSVATSEAWIDKETSQKREKTEWHSVIVWGKLAELCNQYLAKGKQVFVEGRLQTRSWDDKDGNKRYTVEINATTVQFLGASTPQENPHNPQGGENSPTYNVSEDASFAADDIPF